MVLTIAGAHDVSVTAEDAKGAEQTASAAVSVQPGPLAAVDIVLDATEVMAGEVLGYALSAEDEFGNERPTDGGMLTASSEDLYNCSN